MQRFKSERTRNNDASLKSSGGSYKRLMKKSNYSVPVGAEGLDVSYERTDTYMKM